MTTLPEPMRTVAASRCRIPELPDPKAGALHARDVDGRQYYVKTELCKKSGRTNPTWLGNELIYYVIAERSGLRMPVGTLLNVDGSLGWGSEVVAGRCALLRDRGEKVLREKCELPGDNLQQLARALLLDLALLNSDRKPWNILADDHGLWFFDHEKTLLGDGREVSAEGDLGRISDQALTDDKVADYLRCPMANKLVLGCSTDQDIQRIFQELRLNRDSLAAARESCPETWVSGHMFSRLQCFLEQWWNHLRGRLLGTTTPRCYLTHLLLKANMF